MSVDDIRGWRHKLHAYPETAFEEQQTAAFVASQLRSFGIPVTEGIGVTGVVGLVEGRGGGPAIGLRADMDALPIQEETGLPYASTVSGKMHACGHDGHTAMLLGAARRLAETRDFPGRVVLIFQPAEENDGGARRMIEDGLFERFPVDAVFGMHNRPGLPVGRFAFRPGPMMASFDVFEIEITGSGTHAARPHLGSDPVVAAGHIIVGAQAIVSRSIDPVEAVVISITQLAGGTTWNVIPSRVTLRGTVRALKPETRDLAERRIGELAEATARAHRCEARLSYDRRYPVLVNTPRFATFCTQVAQSVVGPDNVDATSAPALGAEDFAFMLQEKPGCLVWLGNGSGDGGRVLHSPHYDFNDDAIEFGVRYWVQLAHMALQPHAILGPE